MVYIHQSSASFRLDFSEGGRDKFFKFYVDALKKKEWEKKESKTEFSASDAGIAGILRKVEKRVESDAKNVNEAFSDLESLVNSADELVKLSQRFKAQQEKQKNRINNNNNDDDGDKNEMSDLLLGLGVASAITKETAGSLYHEELARQLAGTFHPLIMQRGMMTLPDVYCAYNRARGTNLISPEDLYRAALLMEQLQLPLHLRQFESGVIVLEATQHSDKSSAESVLNAIVQHGPLTAFQYASLCGSSITLASQHLLNAEDVGLLCRDESLEGLIFYANNVWK